MSLRRVSGLSALLLGATLATLGYSGPSIAAGQLPAVAAAKVPGVCSADQMRGVSTNADEVKRHREFELPVIDYADNQVMDTWGFDLSLLVDASGRVECHLVEQQSGKPVTITGRRRKLLAETATWRYRPFMRDGEPVSAIVHEHVYEERLPSVIHEPPAVPLGQVVIALDRSGCLGFCPSYTIEIHGDGTAIYTGHAFVDVTGRHTFTIPKEDVAALVQRMRVLHIWSMDKSYRAAVTDNPTYALKLTFGNQTREVEDYVGAWVGMPRAVTEFEDAVDRIGRTHEWTRLSMPAVKQLRHEGFDFESAAAADLLARAVANREGADDSAMLAMLASGTPANGRLMTGNYRVPNDALLESALRNSRTSVVEYLITHGALKTDGAYDPVKATSALRAAIQGGRLRSVEHIWEAMKPERGTCPTYVDTADSHGIAKTKRVPVTLSLERPYGDDRWQGLQIAKWLSGKGCDLRARAANGDTLLHRAVDADDLAFVRYLLAHGLSPSTPGEFGLPALGSAHDEDVALALLQAGSPWCMHDAGEGFLRYAKDQHWGRVLAWVQRHDKTCK